MYWRVVSFYTRQAKKKWKKCDILSNERTIHLSGYLSTYVLLSIGLPCLKIFHFSSKFCRKKAVAVKLQIFILSMSMPGVKQLKIWKKKLHPIRNIQIAFDL